MQRKTDNTTIISGPVVLRAKKEDSTMTVEEFLKRKIIHMLNIAIKANITDRDEKIFFNAIIKDISALDPNSINIPVTVINYLGYVKESAAITILKTDIRDLYLRLYIRHYLQK